MQKLVEYPAIFRKDEENPVYINVSFPDIFAGNTFGEGMEDAMYMAKDLLKMIILLKKSVFVPLQRQQYSLL